MSDFRTYCNKPMHMHCRCIREPNHKGRCNCSYRNPPENLSETNKSWGKKNNED